MCQDATRGPTSLPSPSGFNAPIHASKLEAPGQPNDVMFRAVPLLKAKAVGR